MMSDPPPALPPLPATLAANPVLSAWLDFTCPGVVTIATGKVEYGQGVWTALAQVAAEELDVDLRRVRVAPVSTATSPDEGVTSGSRSIEESGSALRPTGRWLARRAPPRPACWTGRPVTPSRPRRPRGGRSRAAAPPGWTSRTR